MRLTFEFLDRYFQMETGRFTPESDEDAEEETPVVRVPMGFTAVSPAEETDDDEEYEAPEADCA